jgi:hypothetical protein
VDGRIASDVASPPAAVLAETAQVA